MKLLALVLAAAAIVGGLVDNADAVDDFSYADLALPRPNSNAPHSRGLGSPQRPLQGRSRRAAQAENSASSALVQAVVEAAVTSWKEKVESPILVQKARELVAKLTNRQVAEAKNLANAGYAEAAIQALVAAEEASAGEAQVKLLEEADRLRNKLTPEQLKFYARKLVEARRSSPKPATTPKEPKSNPKPATASIEPKRPDAPKIEEPKSTPKPETPEKAAPQSDLAALLQLIHDREQELKARAEEKAAAAIDPLSGFYINAIECANVESAYILKADPRVCDRYVRCAFGNKFVQFCDPGTAFDLETGTCLDKESVDCGDRKAFINEVETENDYDDYVEEEYTGGIQNLDICKKRNGYNKDPTQCRRYYRCQSGVMVQNATCPELTVFDDDNDNCRHPEETNRAECKPTDWYTFECPEFERGVTPRFGDHDRLAHPEDCTLYFSCLHKGGKPRLNTCPPPDAFDPETGKCEPYTEVKGCEGIYSSDYPEEEEEEEEVSDRVARKRINGKFKEDSFKNPFNKEERVEIFRPRYSQ